MGRRSILYGVALMILILSVVELTMLMTARLMDVGQNPDPFTPYEAIMPGQPSAALGQYPCHFEKGLDRDSEPTLCRIRPEGGIFSEVIALFQDADRIRQVTFKPEALHVGDLIQRWGFPDIRDDNREFVYLRWRRGVVYAVVSPDTQARRFSYWLPVYSIILSEAERSRPPLAQKTQLLSASNHLRAAVDM